MVDNKDGLNINVDDISIDALKGDPKSHILDYYIMPVYEKSEEKKELPEIYSKKEINNEEAVVSEIMNDDIYDKLIDINDEILNDEILFDSMEIDKPPSIYMEGFKLTASNIISDPELYKTDLEFNQNDLLGLTGSEVKKMLNVKTDKMLVNLVERGVLRRIKIGSRYRYQSSDVYRLIKNNKKKIIVIYARAWDISNTRTKRAMKKQIKYLLSFATDKKWPVKRIYRDTGFALDFSRTNRKGLHALLYDVIRGRVDFVIIESPDRLSMIGYEMFVQIFRYYGTKIYFTTNKQMDVQYRNEMVGEFSQLQKMIHRGIRRGTIVDTDVDLTNLNYKKLLNI